MMRKGTVDVSSQEFAFVEWWGHALVFLGNSPSQEYEGYRPFSSILFAGLFAGWILGHVTNCSFVLANQNIASRRLT